MCMLKIKLLFYLLVFTFSCIRRITVHNILLKFQVILNEKIKVLKEKCVDQKKKLKCLNEKLRRKNKKIANLKDIIKDLKQKAQINMEQAVLIEDLAGPHEFLKRQMIKSKGLPMPNKYPKEIKKFALTLHFLSPKAYEYIRRTYKTCLQHTRTLCK